VLDEVAATLAGLRTNAVPASTAPLAVA
jgi:hypothetical protein